MSAAPVRFRYVIGDVQGCYASLCDLLNKCDFDPTRDCLWFAGDIVNRGPCNVDVLRFVRSLGERAVCVLGNHDFFLLAVVAEAVTHGKSDTLADILSAPDCDELIDWLRRRPLIHVEDSYAMVHAGLLPQWNIKQALALAGEVQSHLRSDEWKGFLRGVWGGKPVVWHESLHGWDRLRIVVNVMCRLRFLNLDGSIALKPKGPPEDNPALVPWYAASDARWATHTVLHGHWSALGFRDFGAVISLDSGCVWGGRLTAIRLEDRRIFQVPSLEGRVPTGWD